MRIHAKLVSFVSVALVIPLLLSIYYVRYFGRLYYRQQQELIHSMIAEELAEALQDGIHQKVQQIANWTEFGPLSAIASSLPVSPFNPADVQRVESTWSSGREEASILSNSLSEVIRAFERINPEFAEIMMTDSYGRLNGASRPTTDYWQADEEWWQSAQTLSSGDELIQGLLYDESAGALVIDMVFPVFSPGNSAGRIGTLKASLNAARFLQRAAPHPWNKAITCDLVFPDGRIFAHINSGDSPELSSISPELLRELLAKPGRRGAVDLFPGKASLTAIAPLWIMSRPEGDRDAQGDAGELYVVASRGLEETMSPVRTVLRQMTVGWVAVTLLIAGISYLLATFWVARPIKTLRRASMSFVDYIKLSEQGRYEDSWESRQKVRRRMSELETIQSRDELQGLSRDFMRMGERMLVFFRQIEERLADKKQK